MRLRRASRRHLQRRDYGGRGVAASVKLRGASPRHLGVASRLCSVPQSGSSLLAQGKSAPPWVGGPPPHLFSSAAAERRRCGWGQVFAAPSQIDEGRRFRLATPLGAIARRLAIDPRHPATQLLSVPQSGSRLLAQGKSAPPWVRGPPHFLLPPPRSGGGVAGVESSKPQPTQRRTIRDSAGGPPAADSKTRNRPQAPGGALWLYRRKIFVRI